VKDLDYVITEELFYQQGHKIGLDNDAGYRKTIARLDQKGHGTDKSSPEFRSYLASEMRSEMARRVFDTQIAATVDVRMEQGREYFEKNRETINTELHLGLIKYQNRIDALEALKKIRNGASFESLAAADRGTAKDKARPAWDLGFVPWTGIPIDFARPLYQLKPGEVSAVLGNQVAGFQIVKLYDRRKSRKDLEFSDVSGSVMNSLRDLKIVEAHHKYLEQLKKEAKIVTF
jgi:parvulin-like peptidyl-prolyl isomerase